MVRATTSLLMPLQAQEQDDIARQEQAARISNALLELPDEQREVIVLRIFHGLGFKVIADITGDAHSTIRSRFLYGVEKLRGLLKNDFGEI